MIAIGFNIYFRYYSCLAPIDDTWCITQNPFNLFIKKVQIIDGKTLNYEDVIIKWASTTTIIDKKNLRNPERGIVRFAIFLKILVY